ncbi:MAG: hypothetical protein AMJ94_18305 [Deltaproteobacteria bacterium SM23_61]|nr:MAG: hypothetical protein AMJ94_18305 [Deltaproteobacteria bacterium SM23_61]
MKSIHLLILFFFFCGYVFFHFSGNPQKKGPGPQLIRQALGIRASMLKRVKLQKSFHFLTGGIGWMDCPLAETE